MNAASENIVHSSRLNIDRIGGGAAYPKPMRFFYGGM